MRTAFLALALIGAAILGSSVAVLPAQADDAAERAERWDFLRGEIFGERALADGAGIVALEAPDRALDAALVPITVTLSGDDPVPAVYVVVDQHPGPRAAHVTFGPAAHAKQMTFRERKSVR